MVLKIYHNTNTITVLVLQKYLVEALFTLHSRINVKVNTSKRLPIFRLHFINLNIFVQTFRHWGKEFFGILYFSKYVSVLQVAKKRQNYLYTSVEKCLFANISQQERKKIETQNKPDYHKASMRLILQNLLLDNKISVFVKWHMFGCKENNLNIFHTL